jgi:glycosyltransferase involved in cell wall biosynthesis
MLSPVFWPEVRRGGERMVHELSTVLIARGHSTQVITSHRGLPRHGNEDGVPVLRVPRLPDGRLQQRKLEDHLTHLPASYAALRLGHYDVAHAWYQTDALVAARWRTRASRPAVFSYLGIPNHVGLMARRRRLEIFQRAIAGCDVTVALGHSVAAEFRRWLGVDVPVIQPPVNVHQFVPREGRTDHPTIVCAAVADNPGKRVELLVRAFKRVRRALPQARLLINRPRSADLAIALEDHAGGVELVDLDDRDALARRYAEAWVSVLPSTGEAFGLVLAEALACGTPGVGTNQGGIPEVLDRPEIGRLFSGDEEELATALLEAIELARDPATVDNCRARALELSAERCAQAYEALYRDLLSRS